jgi:N-acylneuraminate cytidylyltransferase
MTEILAIIPARGGSKGIPRKNIRPFYGYPLIAYSIAAAQQAKRAMRVLVSTDDKEIAAIARDWGGEVPFLRAAALAQDDTPDLPVFQHALDWLAKEQNYHPEIVVQLRPTSPLRPKDCVDAALQVLLDHPDADSVRGVVPAAQNPHKMWRLPEDGEGPMMNLLAVVGFDEPYNAPRQSLPSIYWQTGHIDAIRAQTILGGSMSGRTIYPLLIDSRYTVDLDNLTDWQRAEWLATFGRLDCVWPGRPRRPMPAKIELLALDFDGVVTDNRVWTDQDGREMVAALRSDSLGLVALREAGVAVIIISSETNPVVAARARKMGAEAIQGVGIHDKGAALQALLEARNIDPANVVYVGNDLNDLPCFQVAGWAVAVADAYPELLRKADYVTNASGGFGAVREVCDMMLSRLKARRVNP